MAPPDLAPVRSDPSGEDDPGEGRSLPPSLRVNTRGHPLNPARGIIVAQAAQTAQTAQIAPIAPIAPIAVAGAVARSGTPRCRDGPPLPSARTSPWRSRATGGFGAGCAGTRQRVTATGAGRGAGTATGTRTPTGTTVGMASRTPEPRWVDRSAPLER